MKVNEYFLEAKFDEIKKGYNFNISNNSYHCLICQKTYSDNLIYKDEHDFCKAEEIIRRHIEKDHKGVFEYLLSFDKRITGVSDIQKNLMRSFFQGMNDKETGKVNGNINQSTVRNHRFRLKEAKTQAKVFLVLMELLEERKHEFKEDDFVEFHVNAKMKDERYETTNSEKEKILKAHFDNNGKLKIFPSKEKKKIIVLQAISEKFEKDKTYNEKEVNQIIREIYDDTALIRRYLIQYGFMDREKDCSKYWVKG